MRSIAMRAARAPPMNVLLDPVQISKIGARPPQVGAMPTSSTRAAGMPPYSTLRQPLPMVSPKLGSGTPLLGGCVCACGTPK
ncbi:hypothetical protein [Paraburkholderia sacchari]|uniref:hypothetical protein n=1 Tax=Paraburkholderia sacchari TaxID=159450 RepID=UPI001F466BE4|nr:hypothetical protein [Paraburkholderia sacchari]